MSRAHHGPEKARPTALERHPLAASAEALGPERRIHVVQGEFFVTDDPRAVLTTILGSCVAACIVDTDTGVGGMNHFLLPGDENSDGLRYGVQSHEAGSTLIVSTILSAVTLAAALILTAAS